MSKRPDTHAERIAAGDKCVSDCTERTIDGRDFAEALKITFTAQAEIRNKTLIGGWEDCLDAVRVGRLSVSDCVMKCGPKTRTFVTAKGGGVEHIYENITLQGTPRWWAFSFGDWTLYNANPEMPPMREVILRRVRREDGKSFIVLQLYCDRVVVEDCRAFVINLRWFTPIWFWLLRTVRKKDPRYKEPIPPWLLPIDTRSTA